MYAFAKTLPRRVSMPVPDQNRFDLWRRHRAAGIQRRAAWVRDEPGSVRPGGPTPVSFVADEVLVRDDHQDAGLNIVSGLGHRRAAIESREAVPGFRVLRAAGLDALAASGRLRDQVGRTREPVASVNHVFMSTPFEHGGPHGEPAAGPSPVSLNVPGAAATRVAVLDTGVWAASPLPRTSYRAAPGDFEVEMDTDADGFIDTDVGHANFVAGVILNRSANAGVRILKVLDPLGLCTEVELAQALLAVTDADVVNLSLGGFTVDDQPPAALLSALGAVLGGQDRIVVAAAGNDGQAGRPFWPAAFSTAGCSWSDQVLAVAAHDGDGVCAWSNSGPWITLAAPGQDVTSTYVNRPQFDSGWATWSGTSFAAPYVAAAIADQVPANGSVVAAAQHVRKTASAHAFGDYPGLP
jgi:thermitase